jgi:hypothetical protein
MGFEPNAGQRLHLMLRSTTDLSLRHELQQLLETSPMHFVPSMGLRNAIAGCDACPSDGVSPVDRAELCAPHRARYNVEVCSDRAALQEGPDEHLDELMRRAMAAGEVGTELLAAFRSQARALDAVWEAYRRGAAQLPDGVASGVERALVKVPRLLGGPTLREPSVA